MSVNTASSTRDTVKVIIQLEQVMPHVIELFSTLIDNETRPAGGSRNDLKLIHTKWDSRAFLKNYIDQISLRDLSDFGKAATKEQGHITKRGLGQPCESCGVRF